MSTDCKVYATITFAINGILSVLFCLVGVVAYFGSASTAPTPIVGVAFWFVSGYAFIQAFVHLFNLAFRSDK